MYKIKMYGVGGQGIVTAAKILSVAVSLYGRSYAVTIPSYGHERRGAPVNTSIVIDDKPVLLNCFVYEPDVVVVTDLSIPLKGVDSAQGINENSILVLNTDNKDVALSWKKMGFKTVYYANATEIALQKTGLPIPNCAILGVLAAAGIAAQPSIVAAVKDIFKGKAGEKNAEAAREAFNATAIC